MKCAESGLLSCSRGARDTFECLTAVMNICESYNTESIRSSTSTVEMSALDNICEIEKILNSDSSRSRKTEVMSLIEKGIDPTYKNGDVVVRVEIEYGSSTLVWYTKETSAVFMHDLRRAWNIVNAAYKAYKKSGGSEGITQIYKKDSREDKRNSVAYLRALRTSLLDNSLFSLELVKLMGKNYPPAIFQALTVDFTSSKNIHKDIHKSVYVITLSELAAVGYEKVSAFASFQAMLAEHNGDRHF